MLCRKSGVRAAKKVDELAVIDLAREVAEESRARRKWITVPKPDWKQPEKQESPVTQTAVKIEDRACSACQKPISRERLAQWPKAEFCSRECRDAVNQEAAPTPAAPAPAADAAADPDKCIECGGSRRNADGKRQGAHGKCMKCYMRARDAAKREAKKTSQSSSQSPKGGATPHKSHGASGAVVTTSTASHDSHAEASPAGNSTPVTSTPPAGPSASSVATLRGLLEAHERGELVDLDAARALADGLRERAKSSGLDGDAMLSEEVEQLVARLAAPRAMCAHCKVKPIRVHKAGSSRALLYCSDDCQIAAARARYEVKHRRRAHHAAGEVPSRPTAPPELEPAAAAARMDTDAAVDVLKRAAVEDDELAAMGLCLAVLRLLPRDAQRRSLRYLETRLAGGVASA